MTLISRSACEKVCQSSSFCSVNKTYGSVIGVEDLSQNMCSGCVLSHKFDFFPSLKTFFFAQVMLSVSEGECKQGSRKDTQSCSWPCCKSRAKGRVLKSER